MKNLPINQILCGDCLEVMKDWPDNKGAQFSKCRRYRYALWRTWDENNGHVMFIGLNPSTADEKEDDPTIRRCIGYAKSWGFGGIYMLNIFAFRATKPRNLRDASDPIGSENDDYLKMYCDNSGLNIACWGTHGAFMNRGQSVIELLGKNNLSCLGITKSGQPKHPLYLKRDIKPLGITLFQRLEAVDTGVPVKEQNQGQLAMFK